MRHDTLIFSKSCDYAKRDKRLTKRTNLEAFNDSITHPYGIIKLLVSFGGGLEKRMIYVCFMMVPLESVYCCIQGSPFFTMLDIVTSTAYLKIKYHNNHNESVTIQVDLFDAHSIHET